MIQDFPFSTSSSTARDDGISKMRRTVILASILALLSCPAWALDGRLVGLGGSNTVFVWRSSEAHGEALELIQAGVHNSNPALVAVLLACVVPSGTRAVTTDFGLVTHDIMVISGEDAGCRGNIPVESFATD